MMKPLLPGSRNSRLAWALSVALTLVLAAGLSLPSPLARAAPGFTVSPVAAPSSSLPVRVTVTATESAFTAGESTPYLLLNGQAQSVNISNVTSTATRVEFTIGAGLASGTYTVRIVSPAGTHDVGSFTVGNPSITAVSPDSLAKDYDQQVTVTVTGQNTNFKLGQSSVDVLNSQGQVVANAVGGVTAVNSTSQLVFTLNTGLSTGTYSVRVTTGTEVVTASDALQVRGTPSLSLSPNKVSVGYSSTVITVTGTNTGFGEATTVTVLDQNGQSTGKAGTPTVYSRTSLGFSLGTGLSAGSYTVRVTTGSEVATATLTVATPTATLQYQGNSFARVGAGYASSYTLTVAGTNTNFAQGSTSIALFNSNNQDITATYVSNPSVSNSTTATFTLGTGLAVDTYTVQVTTGQEVVSSTFQVVSPAIQSLTFNSPVASGTSIPQGYKDIQQVVVVGTNTSFQTNTTVEVVGQTGKTSAINVVDSTHLSFALASGLAAGSYTLRVDMDGNSGTTTDRADVSFTVTAPSIVSVTPAGITNSVSSPVTITVVGLNTHFNAATPTVDITGVDNETISGISTVSDTQLTFNLTPSSIATPGTYGLTIITNSSAITETAGGTNLLTVSTSGISGLSPSVVYSDELGTRQITVTGTNTLFAAGSTAVKVDGTPVSGVSVGSTTSLSFTAPLGLSAGTHAVSIDQDGDGTDDYSSSFLVSQRAITLSTTTRTAGYSAFNQVVTGQGVTFASDYKPVIKVLEGATERATIAAGDITVVDATRIQFSFPTGLAAGSYTVQASWSSGQYSGLTLATPFDVTHQISSLYIKKAGQVVNTVEVLESTASFSLTAWGVMIIPGPDEEKTSVASWEVASGTDVVSVSAGQVTVLGPGSAVVRVSYDGQTAEVTINVQSLSVQSLSLSLIGGSTSIIAGVTTATVRATGTMNDSSQQDLTSAVTWSSSPTGALSVDSSGVVSGTTATAGMATLTASYAGVTSNSITFDVSVSTTGLTVSPSSNLSVAVGSNLALTASASRSYGPAVDVSSTATWTSSDETRATVANGVVTGVAAGTVTITASYDGRSANVTLTVQAVVPPVPTGLMANPVSSSRINLSWGAVSGATGYKVYRSTLAGGTYTLVTTTNSTSYGDTGLSASTTYWYKVTAFNTAGDSDYSAAVSATTQVAPPPAPTGLTANPVSSNRIELSWSPAIGATEYKVYRSTSEGGTYYRIGTATTASYSDTGLSASTTYWYKVKASNAGGDSDYSAAASATTLAAAVSPGSTGGLPAPAVKPSPDIKNITLAADAAETVSSGDGNLTVDIPAGALTRPANLNATALTSQEVAALQLPEKYTLASLVYEITLDAPLSKPVTLVFKYTARQGPQGAVYYYHEGRKRWIYLGGTVNLSEGTVTVAVRHFTRFAVMADASLPSMSDVPGHWAADTIKRVVGSGFASGYPDGSFGPNLKISRAEFAKLLVDMMGLAPGGTAADRVKDAASIPGWAKGHLAKAMETGLIKGYEDGSLRPGSLITRGEMVVMMVRAARALGLQLEQGGTVTFADAGKVPSWARDALVLAVKNGLAWGREDNTFGPWDTASRAEAVTFLYRLLEKLGIY